MVTDVTIISEKGRRKEEAGLVQGVVATPDKGRRGGELRGPYLNFFSFMDKFRFWQATYYPPFLPVGPFPCPEGLRTGGFRFPHDSSLSRGAGIVFLESTAFRYTGSEGQGMPKFLQNFMGPATWLANSWKFVLSCSLRYKRGNLSELNSGKKIPKTFFDCGAQGCRIISDYQLFIW
jgi:hypothetical protein